MCPLKSSDNELTTLNCIHFQVPFYGHSFIASGSMLRSRPVDFHIFMVILAFGKCLLTETSEGCEIQICLQKVDVTVLSLQLMIFKADMFFICTESSERLFIVEVIKHQTVAISQDTYKS